MEIITKSENISLVEARLQAQKELDELKNRIKILDKALKDAHPEVDEEGVKYATPSGSIHIFPSREFKYADGLLEELSQKNNGTFTALFHKKVSYTARKGGNPAIFEYANSNDNELAKALKSGMEIKTITKLKATVVK